MPYSAPAFVDYVSDLNVPSIKGELDTIRLSNGGFAVIGDQNGHISGAIYGANGAFVQGIANIAGTNGAIAQLDNGNLVVVSQDAEGVRWTIVDDATGQTVNSLLAGPGATNPDVTALSGGKFAVAYQYAFASPDIDVSISIFTNEGLSEGFFAPDITVATDTDVTVAGLDNGNIAFAWTRTDADDGDTHIMYAVYNSGGTPILARTELASNDTSINRHAHIEATNEGFAIAYERRTAPNFTIPSSVDIWVDHYDFAGVRQDQTIVTNAGLFLGDPEDGSDDSRPHLSRSPDGNLLVTYLKQNGEAGVAVLKGNSLISATFTGTGQDIAGVVFGAAQFAIFQSSPSGTHAERFFGHTDGAGGEGDDVGIGDDFLDTMNGGGGNDTLYGNGNDDQLKGDNGTDESHGGDGNDSIIPGDMHDDDLGDIAFGDGGNDYIEGATGADTFNGGTGNDTLIGAEGRDILRGDEGNDRIDGGADGDQMRGGLGNDTYFVDSDGDRITEETAGPIGGTDTVFSTVGFRLGANLERLTLQEGAAIVGNGNELANLITGNTGNNLLQGFAGADTLIGGAGKDRLDGGEGSDSLAGGAGDDAYTVNGAGDIVVEDTAGTPGGIDTVFSSVSFRLGANLEILRLQGGDPLTGNGNELRNTIDGNTGANLLQGFGGNDQIAGFAGEDRIFGGDGDDSLSGGGNNDKIEGGIGSDTMSGGDGADTFRFGTANAGIDRILDFNRTVDRFDLLGGQFTSVAVSGANTVLHHTGGTIIVQGVTGLSLAQWQALSAAPMATPATLDGAQHPSAAQPHDSLFGSHLFSPGDYL